MFRVYTPQAWRSMFPVESLTITDDGLIYSGYSNIDALAQPIGKVDWAGGYIYGADYYKTMPIAIGRIVQEGSRKYIYGPDYAKMGAIPLFYIQDAMIYNYDQSGKILPVESGYIENQKSSINENANINRVEETKGNASFGCFGVSVKAIVICFLLILLIIAGVRIFLETFSSEEYYMVEVRNMIIISFIVTMVGLIAYNMYLYKKSGPQCTLSFMMNYIITVPLMVILTDAQYMYAHAGSNSIGQMILYTLLGAFIFLLVLIIPSILIALFITVPFYIAEKINIKK